MIYVFRTKGVLFFMASQTAAKLEVISSLWLETPDGVIISRRPDTDDNEPGLFGPAVIEHAEVGETPEQTIRRGMSEELGLEGLYLNRFAVAPMQIGGYSLTLFAAFWEIEWPIGRADGTEPLITANPDEVAQIGWVERSSLFEWVERKPELFVATARLWKSLFEMPLPKQFAGDAWVPTDSAAKAN
jgi:isopentenyldiphosphate isomerase